jgi:hypothetical protein
MQCLAIPVLITAQRYVRGGAARRLRECRKQIDDADEAVSEVQKSEEKARTDVARLQEETSSSEMIASRIRDNLRVRAMRRDIEQIKLDKSKIDLVELGKMKAEYDRRYDQACLEESNAQTLVRTSPSMLSYIDQNGTVFHRRR